MNNVERFNEWMLNTVKSIHYASNEMMYKAFTSEQKTSNTFKIFKSNPELVKEKYNHKFKML